MLAPIILFVYNRPEHTRKTVEALQKNELASESILYVFADGAKPNATQEQLAKINEVREYIESINGFKKVHIEISEKNKGLANSVIAGVTKIIEEYGRVIVVEDDIVTHPFFLRFMNDCLDTYEKRQDIYMIGGYNQNFTFPWWYKKDVYLTWRSCSWGWATWKNRWDNADWEVKGYEEMLNDKSLQQLFNRGGDDNFPMLKCQMEGKCDSWCIRWDYCMFKNNAFCVAPRKTLVNNCGIDGTGVHCGEFPPNYTAPYPSNKNYYFVLEENIKFYPEINERLKSFLRQDPTKFRALLRFVKRIIKNILFIRK